ncbi:hypothetical protein BC938DRAFT_477111 [Jimgerdemannia flammicorona]|uniref:UBA domain-containing protein n=1 Tax=Jimgerdemannia flammicorona TaxID=994334 RepID=A0A433QPR8_9FUNG|nr:hypothetical protein BC938DRAFT_477111 [Jimgerdemannia flammicorona]
MSTVDSPPEDAISSLTDLGITRQQATSALMKYNNDVARAADYIFSGNALDDDEPPPLLEQHRGDGAIDPGYEERQRTQGDTDGTPNGIEDRDDLVIGKQSDACLIPSSLPSYHPASYVLVDDDPKIDVKPREPVSNNDYPEDLQRALEASVGDRERHDIEKATAESLAHTQPTELTAAKSSYYDPNKWAVVTVNKNEDDVNLTRAIKASISLTWWTDPDDPKMRTRVPGFPTALRPPTHGYQFTPPVLQALYHVPIFRRVVLGYRPSIERWGSPDGYWRGEGDSLPIIQPMPDTDEDDEQRPPYAGQAGEAVLLPTSMKSFYELQKLFAFMELTDRSYGNVMHVLRSLHLPQPAGWDDPEGSVEDLYGHFDTLMFERSPERAKYVFFDRIPEVMVINLDRQSRSRVARNWGSSSAHYHHRNFRIDKFFYMDRYLNRNRDEILRRYRLKEKWGWELNELRKEYAGLVSVGNKNITAVDLLRGTMDYFNNTRPSLCLENSDFAMDDMYVISDHLERTTEQIQKRITVLEAKQEELERCIVELFDTDDMRLFDYRLHAVLMHDGNNGSGRHWAYVWVTQKTADPGQWMRFCDAEVRKVSEDEVFNDRVVSSTGGGIYALIYSKGEFEVIIDELRDIISSSLKAFVLADNHSHDLDSRSYAERDRYHEDEVSRDSSPSIPDTPTFEDAPEPNETAQPTLTLGSGASYLSMVTDMPMQERGTLLMFEMDQVQSDDYRILQRFEYFLAKVGNIRALQWLLSNHVGPELMLDDEPLVISPAARQDPRLLHAYQAFDWYTRIAEPFVEALECMLKDEFARAIELLLELKRKEAGWLQGWSRSSEVRDATPRAEELSRAERAQLYGKILDESARRKIVEVPAYRSRGLEDAIRIAQQTQTLVGPENVTTDSFLARLREQWLELPESLTNTLEGPQSEMLNQLVMIYLNEEPVIVSSPSSDASAETFVDGASAPESMAEHGLPRYQDLVPGEVGGEVRASEREVQVQDIKESAEEEEEEEEVSQTWVGGVDGSETVIQAGEPVWKRYRDAKNAVDQRFNMYGIGG